MLLNSLMALVLFGTVGATKQRDVCQPDADGYCTSTVVYADVSYERPDLEIKANMTIGNVLVIELPRSLDVPKAPSVGNKSFKIEMEKWEQDRHVIELRFELPDDMRTAKAEDINGVGTNLYITLAGPFGITVHVRAVTDSKTASRIIITCGESDRVRSVVQREIAKERALLQKEYDERQSKLTTEVRTFAKKDMASALWKWRHCNEFVMRRMRAERDLLTVFGKDICRFGDYVFLGFRLVNNRADLFHLKSVRVFGDGVDMQAGWDFGEGRTTVELGLDEETLGVAYLDIAGRDTQPKQFSLQISEDGGANRVVTLDDFDF